MVAYVPVIHDPTAKTFRPLAADETLLLDRDQIKEIIREILTEPAALISDCANNQLTLCNDGLFVPPCDLTGVNLISADTPNLLQLGTDGLLQVTRCEFTAGDLVSQAAGNILTVDTADGLLKVTPDDCQLNPAGLISPAADNQLSVSVLDGLLHVAPQPECAVDPDALRSADAGNALVLGGDGKLKAVLPECETQPDELRSSDNGNALGLGGDGKLKVDLTDILNRLAALEARP